MQSKQKLDSILSSLREYAKPSIGKQTLLRLIIKSVETLNPYPWLNRLLAYDIIEKQPNNGIFPFGEKTVYKINYGVFNE